MRALIPDVPYLQNEFAAQFLLHIQVPGLGVRRLLISRDAVDVEWRLRRACSKDCHSHAKGNRRRRDDCESGGWANGILRQAHKIVQWCGVVINAVSRTHYRLPSWNQDYRRCPG